MESEEVTNLVAAVRAAILEGAPAGQDGFGYGMPAIMLDGRYLLYYGAWKAHLGLYPVPARDAVDGLSAELEAEVAPYRSGRSTLRFRYNEPIPFPLITLVAKDAAERRVGVASQKRPKG